MRRYKWNNTDLTNVHVDTLHNSIFIHICKITLITKRDALEVNLTRAELQSGQISKILSTHMWQCESEIQCARLHAVSTREKSFHRRKAALFWLVVLEILWHSQLVYYSTSLCGWRKLLISWKRDVLIFNILFKCIPNFFLVGSTI